MPLNQWRYDAHDEAVAYLRIMDKYGAEKHIVTVDAADIPTLLSYGRK